VHLSTVSNIYNGTGWTSPCTCYLDGSLIRQRLSCTDMFVQGVRDVLHDDIGSVALHLEVMDTGDIWVVEAGSESGTIKSALKSSGIGLMPVAVLSPQEYVASR